MVAVKKNCLSFPPLCSSQLILPAFLWPALVFVQLLDKLNQELPPPKSSSLFLGRSGIYLAIDHMNVSATTGES